MVDDDVDFQQSMAAFLAAKGFFVVPTRCCADFLSKLEVENPDIVLVDKEIGFEDGFDLIHEIRKHQVYGSLPIIVITGRATESNKAEAIQFGADDLLPKPVQVNDLVLRIEALLRRSQSYISNEQTLKFSGIEINLRLHSITVNAKPIELTKTEYKIFTELILKKGQIISREQVAQKFLSFKNQSPRTIDVHVTSLRKKLGDHGLCIKTVRGRGYMFHMETSEAIE